MKRILKYELKDDLTTIQLPALSQILTVQIQNSKPHVWVLVDDYYPEGERTFFIFGTGEEIPDMFSKDDYVGTFQMLEGMLVWHVFFKRQLS